MSAVTCPIGKPEWNFSWHISLLTEVSGLVQNSYRQVKLKFSLAKGQVLSRIFIFVEPCYSWGPMKRQPWTNLHLSQHIFFSSSCGNYENKKMQTQYTMLLLWGINDWMSNFYDCTCWKVVSLSCEDYVSKSIVLHKEFAGTLGIFWQQYWYWVALDCAVEGKVMHGLGLGWLIKLQVYEDQTNLHGHLNANPYRPI